MQDYQLPEMLRVGLEDLALQILTLDLGEPSEFLAKAMNPPSLIAMKNSLALLERLGAVECCWQNDSSEQNAIEEVVSEGCQRLDVSTELTALGFHLASLPVEPRVGKMMVYGALLGCVDESLTIAAAMTTSKPLFVSPFGQRDAADEARRSHAIAGSDHLTALAVFQEWKKLRKMKGRAPEQTFLKDNFLNRSTLFQIEELKRHYINLLADIGFLPRGYRPDNHVSMSSSQTGIVDGPSLTKVKAVLCAGLYPNVIVAPKVLVNGEAKQEAGELPFRSHRKGDVYLHPSTVSFKEKQLESRYCCFHEIVQTSKLYVRDCTPINPLALLLFGGSLDIYRLANAKSVATIDRWLEFRIPMRHAALVKHLRLQMETVLLQKIVSPGEEVDNSATAKALVDSIGILLGNEEAKAVTTNSIEIQDGREIVRPFHFSAESSGRGRGRGRGGRGRRRGRSDRSANR